MRFRAKQGEPTPHAKSRLDPSSPKDGAEPRADDLLDEASCNCYTFDDDGDTTHINSNNEGVNSSNNSWWADLWFFSALLLVPLVPILSASTLHTLIFALASAPLAAASVNFYRRVSNDGTPRITVAIYQAAHPASYAQLTMAFEENQRLPSNTVPVCKWLKNWGTAGAHGLTKRFCQLLSPTKRAAHAAVRIQAAVRGHQRRNLTKRAAVRIQAAVRGHQCRVAVSVHVWALQRIVATTRGWVTRFKTRKLKITKMASDLRRRLDAWPTAATTIAAFWRGSKTRQWIGAWPAAVTKIAAFWRGTKIRQWRQGEPRRIAMAWLRSDHEAKVATAAAQEAQRSRKKKKKRSGNRKPKAQAEGGLQLPSIRCPDKVPWAFATYHIVYLLFSFMEPMADFGEPQVVGLQRAIVCNMEEIEMCWRGRSLMYITGWRMMAPMCYQMGPAYLDLLLHGVRVMAMELRYATVPMPSTTEFARHLNVWLIELCTKIKAGRGLLTPPGWAWEMALEAADDDDEVPRAFYLFNELIIAGIRIVDQLFGVDHNNDLWPAEDEEWVEEGLGRSEDDSETNTDSEAEDALEFMLAFA